MDYLGLPGVLCPYLHTARFSALQQIMLSDSLMLVPAYMIIYFPHTKILFAINGFTFSHSFSLTPTLLFLSSITSFEADGLKRWLYILVKMKPGRKRKLHNFLPCWAFSIWVHFWTQSKLPKHLMCPFLNLSKIP